MRNLYIIITLFFAANLSFGQVCPNVSANEPWTWPAHNNWFFGTIYYTGTIFNQKSKSVTTVTSIQNQISAYEGTTAASDDNGNLLFFSNGRLLWDASGKLKYSGLLAGNEGGGAGNKSSASQGVITVKHPLSKNFYIFTTDDAIGSTLGFNYFVFDSLGNNISPLGANRLGIYRTTEGVAATRHSNGLDLWITAMGSGNGNFYTYLLTCEGLDTVPIVSSEGPLVTGDYERGGLVFSHDGKKFAQCHPNGWPNVANRVSIYNFNNTTGVISDPLHLASYTAQGPLDIVFSPDNKKLYYSTTDGSLKSFDITSGVAATITSTEINLGTNLGWGNIEIGADGYLYRVNNRVVARWNNNLNTGIGNYSFTNIAGLSGELGMPTMFIPPSERLELNIADSVCVGENPIDFSAKWSCIGTSAENQVGNIGTWEGLGITDTLNGIFDPSLAGIGVHKIKFSYKSKCTWISDSANIKVYNNGCITSTQKVITNEFAIFPNPANDFITVKGSFVSLSITNELGQIVIESSSNNIDISQLKAGFYLVRMLDNNNKTSNFPLIKN